ncbi:hypothetical protein [Nonomuraea sp. KM90]|uniref:hypothetical protein n=1 Tax=Nonomuraea sp. KM90 TaxID=3457428 RepID=UPI003FCC40BD
MKISSKLAAVAATALLGAALTVPAVPAGAWSCGLNPAPHCYGIAEYHEPSFDRFGLDLWTDCLHLDTPSTHFASHEVWYVTAPAAWEAGYLKGTIANIDNPTTHFRYFWGEYLRGVSGTYHGHFISLAQVSTWKNVTGRSNANGTWNIFLGGTQVGTTTYTYPTTGQVIQVGGETTDPYVYSHGKSRYLQKRSISTGTWSGATLDSIEDDFADVYYTTASATEMEQTSLNNMCSPAPAAAKQAAGEPVAAAGVRKQAVAFAKYNGDASPDSIEAVETTRKKVKGNAGVSDDQPVVTIQMRGDFVGNLAPVAKGDRAPKGDTLTVTLDKKTGEITDWSIGSSPQDLKKLGAVKAL